MTKILGINTVLDMKVLEWLNKATEHTGVLSAIHFDAVNQQAIATDSYHAFAAALTVYDQNSNNNCLDGLWRFKRKAECGLFNEVDGVPPRIANTLAHCDSKPVTMEILVNAAQMQDAFSVFDREQHPVRMVFHGQTGAIELYGKTSNWTSAYAIMTPRYFYETGFTWRPR